MNLYGIVGCVILFVLIPLGAVLHELHLRRSGDINSTIQETRRLPRNSQQRYAADHVSGINPEVRPPAPNIRRVA
jgi:hypothetical protein